MRRPQTVRSGVTATDNHHPFVLCGDLFDGQAIAGIHLVLLDEILHGKVDTVQVTTGHRQVTRLFGPQGQAHCIELPEQVVSRDVHTDVHVGLELHAFRDHLLQPSVDDPLFHFEIRNAVTQQPADAVGFLIDGDAVSCPG